ncbi:MAG TPA: hypothetical protein VFN10_09950 [Thermoanaerobaculia bacterium]|nr:hypothetical protein [Thermoanaerobaculia bacterium]
MILTALGALLLGCEVSFRLWRAPLAACERALFAMLMAAMLWLGSTWALAIPHLMTHEAVLARGVIFFVAGAVAIGWRVSRAKLLSRELDHTATFVLIALVPLALWIVFALWRGAIIPPLSHDALSYHLPKSVLYQRAHGFDSLSSLEWLFAPRPANYELLVADVLASDGVDDRTEWLSTFFYLGLVVSAGALAQRWWRAGPLATAATVLLTGAVPVLLLHSSAHKNDVMAAFFAAAGFVAASRWIATREAASLFAMKLAFGAAAGTKGSMAVIALCFVPVVAWTLARPRIASPRILAAAFAGVLAFLILGGWYFIERKLRPAAERQPTAIESSSYGDWQNLYQGPYVLLTAPFSANPLSLAVPWDARRWFWRRYEIYFSHDGIPFALSVLALPFALWLLRRRASLHERVWVSAAALAAFLALLPAKLSPAGLYVTMLPRFTVWIVPLVFAWTVAPLIDAIAPRWQKTLVAVSSVIFVLYAVDSAQNDSFAPFDYVLWARVHPGTRTVPFDANRASCRVDRVAGPHDKIVIQAGSSAWVYPAFGAHLTRPVELIRSLPAANISEDARWLIVDYKFDVIWSGPALKSLGDTEAFLGGTMPEAGQQTIRTMRVDPRWKALEITPWGEAVFVRVR